LPAWLLQGLEGAATRTLLTQLPPPLLLVGVAEATVVAAVAVAVAAVW
jgi:hypothetical protein